ncbi:MAG: PAS domain S-box protein [Chloroflexi bacterium]|nr:PAS domain S-box protein [Chloroflexota bacterium]
MTDIYPLSHDDSAQSTIGNAIRESEERLRQALDTADIGVFEYDPRRGRVRTSLYHGQGLDQAWDEAVPLDRYLDAMLVEDRERVREALLRSHDAAGNGLFQMEYRVAAQDGSIRWIKNRSRTLFEGAGSLRQAVKTIGVITDITEQKQIEMALRKSEARYRTLIETQSDLISRYREDMTLTFVNDAYCQFYGKTREELIGHSLLTMVAPEFHEAVRAEAAYMIANPAPVSGEYLNYAADGQEHWIHWIIKGVPDETGQITELQAIGHDITRLKQAEESMRASEERLRQAVRVGNIGIFDADHVKNNIFWSPEQRQIWGWDEQSDVMLPGVLNQVHPDDREELARATEKAQDPAGDGTFEMEYRILGPDGNVRWLNVRSQSFFGGEGEARTLARTIGATTNITASKHQEVTLRHLNQRLSILRDIDRLILSARSVSEVASTVLEQLAQLIACEWVDIVLFDQTDKHTQSFAWRPPTNRTSAAYPLQPLVSAAMVTRLRSAQSTVIVDLRTEIDKSDLVREAIQQGIRSAMAIPLSLQERLIGYLALASSQVAYFTSEHQATAEAIAAQVALAFHQADLNDQIARQKAELEQRVIERTKELQEANEEVKNFAYIVSHDLRAPLVNLKGFAAELRMGLKEVEQAYEEVLPLTSEKTRHQLQHALKEDVPEALRFIDSSVSTMDSFTKAILKLSRLGRLQLEWVSVDVRSIVDTILDGLSHEIRQKKVQVTITDLPTVTADFVSMEQIFGNILTNAVAYLVPERPGEIVISAEESKEGVVFRIRDNGRGIAPEDMDKVFAPFRRAGRLDVPGEGMGLAYVQALVRRHGGYISCESELGVGTTFAFNIPMVGTHDAMPTPRQGIL